MITSSPKMGNANRNEAKNTKSGMIEEVSLINRSSASMYLSRIWVYKSNHYQKMSEHS